MSQLTSWFQRMLPFKRLPPIDRYHIAVVTSPEELTFGELLPIELRYVLAMRPVRFETFRKLLESGFGIGVRTVDKTPERVLQAVDCIARETQCNTIMPWLELLLRNGEQPVFSEDDLRRAKAKDIDLYQEVRLIVDKRYEFKKIVLVALDNQCIGAEDRRLMQEVNEDLYPHAVEAVINRVVFDNAHTRTEVAQALIKALLIVGPVAHVLERVLSGIGKVFAATADDLLSETAELFALRGSGFSWRQLIKRSRLLIPVFILATVGAFSVERFVTEGRLALAGIIFGASAVALSLTTAVQSIFLYRRSYDDLVKQHKLRLERGSSTFSCALRQDFTNPARLGLFAGALASPVIAAAVFVFAPQFTKNGWVLALLGSTESVVASLTVILAVRINRWWFRARVRGAIGEHR